MHKYTPTEIVSAKKMALKLNLFSIAAYYRNLECKILGIEPAIYPASFFKDKPKGVYIDLTAFKNRFR